MESAPATMTRAQLLKSCKPMLEEWEKANKKYSPPRTVKKVTKATISK